jgi:hypothetical protein
MQTGMQRIEATLAHLVASGADAASIAEVSCVVWRDVAAALSPVIGQQGVAALYNRSLYLTRNEHSGLSAVHDAAGDVGDFTALHKALSSQPSSGAATANSALLKNFYDLLSSLIGPALTERLLRPALDKPPINHAAQDPQP